MIANPSRQLVDELRLAVIGQDRMLERIVTCVLAGGHCLVEGAPGLAKTLALRTLAAATEGTFSRIQFTPDLLPSDIVGIRVWRPSEDRFQFEEGPVFANFVLADEINRAPAKVQSALLEVMEERQVTVADRTLAVPDPFFVLATQNPIESEGVYPLPEAQRDRFLMRVIVDHPDAADERRIAVLPPLSDRPQTKVAISSDALSLLQKEVASGEVSEAALDYAVRLVLATRSRDGESSVASRLLVGASPRATQGLLAAAKGLAMLRGKELAGVQEIYDVAFDVLNHRLVCTYDALADGDSAGQVTVDLLKTVPAGRRLEKV